jgi:hypothetical protein
MLGELEGEELETPLKCLFLDARHVAGDVENISYWSAITCIYERLNQSASAKTWKRVRLLTSKHILLVSAKPLHKESRKTHENCVNEVTRIAKTLTSPGEV